MKIKATPDFSNVETLDQLKRFSSAFCKDAEDVINGGITFSDNMKVSIVTVTFSAANTQVVVAHGLGAVPTGYIVAGTSAAMSIYDGGSTNTDGILYLKSSATGSARVIVF